MGKDLSSEELVEVEFTIHESQMGKFIGRGGETIKAMQFDLNCQIDTPREGCGNVVKVTIRPSVVEQLSQRII